MPLIHLLALIESKPQTIKWNSKAKNLQSKSLLPQFTEFFHDDCIRKLQCTMLNFLCKYALNMIYLVLLVRVYIKLYFTLIASC